MLRKGLPMTLAYESFGQGIPLVLIHAFPLSSHMWNSQIKNLEQSVKVIAPDLPGFGRSPCQAKPCIEEMAQKIDRLLDSLKVKEPVMIAGLSMGGYIAFEFLRQFPNQVRGLGLFSTRPGADNAEAREKRLKTAQNIRASGLEPFAKTILPNLLGKTTLESNPDLVDKTKRMILANNSEGIACALLAMADRQDSTELLKFIQCPTLIIAGNEDTLIPSSEAETMHSKIPNSQLHIIEKAGHLVNLEQPEEFQKILEEFLITKFLPS